jgi:transposase-like protein
MQARRGKQCVKGGKEKKNKKWSQEQMNQAYQLVVVNKQDIAVAARECGVPRRTLGDRINGRVTLTTANGRPSALTNEEEKRIVSWCDRMNDMGFEVGQAEIEDAVHKWLPKLQCSDGWWDGFRKRNPELVLRKTQKME